MSNHQYLCNGCGKPTARDMLTVKKTVFSSMGEGASVTRSRVVAWLCVPCVRIDPGWNLPKNRTPAERVQVESVIPKEDELA